MAKLEICKKYSLSCNINTNVVLYIKFRWFTKNKMVDELCSEEIFHIFEQQLATRKKQGELIT